jgi:hypothetical protein
MVRDVPVSTWDLFGELLGEGDHFERGAIDVEFLVREWSWVWGHQVRSSALVSWIEGERVRVRVGVGRGSFTWSPIVDRGSSRMGSWSHARASLTNVSFGRRGRAPAT